MWIKHWVRALASRVRSRWQTWWYALDDAERRLHYDLLELADEVQIASARGRQSRLELERLDDEFLECQRRAAENENRLRQLVLSGDETEMEEAVARRLQLQRRCERLTGQRQTLRAEVSVLEDQLQRLEDQLEEAHRRKAILLARQARAETESYVQWSLRNTDESRVAQEFAILEELTDLAEREAERTEISDSAFTNDRRDESDLGSFPSAVANRRAEIDDEVKRLKMTLDAREQTDFDPCT